MKAIIGVGMVLALLVIVPSVGLVMAAGDTPGEYLNRTDVIW